MKLLRAEMTVGGLPPRRTSFLGGSAWKYRAAFPSYATGTITTSDRLDIGQVVNFPHVDGEASTAMRVVGSRSYWPHTVRTYSLRSVDAPPTLTLVITNHTQYARLGRRFTAWWQG